MKHVWMILTLICGLLAHLQAQEAAATLTFHAGFDGTLEAVQAAGQTSPVAASEPVYRPGIEGEGLLIGGPRGEGISHFVRYAPEQNLDFTQGTISFWLQPLDWDGKTEGSMVLFKHESGSNLFWIYKFWRDAMFSFVRGDEANNGYTMTRINEKMRHWERGEWRHIVATWNPMGMSFYIDGALVVSDRCEGNFENLEPTHPFGLGDPTPENLIGTSLVDELRIYDRPLTSDDVVRLYLAHAHRAGSSGGLITLGEQTPGDADDAFAYSFTGFGYHDLSGRSAPERGAWRLSYDQHNLYIAMTTPGPVRADDWVQLLLATSPQAPLQRFALTPWGSTETLDSQALPIETRSEITADAWTVEAAIPFQVLGQAEAPEGETWRINLARHRGDSQPPLSIAPVVGRVSDVNHFFRLHFRSDAPRLRFSGGIDLRRELSDRHVAAEPVHPNSTITYHVRIDEQRDTKDGLRIGAVPLVADGVPKPMPHWTRPLRLFEMNELAITETRNGEESPLFFLRSISETLQPLIVDFLYTQDKQRLYVSAMRNRDAKGDMRVRFVRPDGSVAFSAAESIPQDAKHFAATYELDFTQLTPGDYTVAVDYLSPNGEASELHTQAYRVPEANDPMFQPYVDPEADHAPYPWSPVVWEDTGRVGIWGRSYDFSDGFLFSGLSSQDEQLLTAPAHLTLDGDVLTPIGTPTLQSQAANDVHASFTKQADFDGLQVTSEITVHFDGYCEIAMTITPAADQQVDSLSLDLPLRRDMAELVRDNLLSQGEGTKSGAVGDYWTSDLFNGRGYYVWIGNDDAGFNWVAPSLENWHCTQTEKSLEVIKEGDIATLRFNLIDTQLTLSEPRTIRWGFSLTPTRPLNPYAMRLRSGKNFQNGIFQPWVYFAYPQYDTIKKSVVDYKATTIPDLKTLFLYMGHGLTSGNSPEWAFWEEDWRAVWGINNKYGKLHGAVHQPYVSACIFSDSFRNWLNHKRAIFFEDAKEPLHPALTSYYFDTGVGASVCRNEAHGCDHRRWTDANGNQHGYMPIDRYRDISLNVYRMIKRTQPNPETGTDALVYAHQGWLRAMPMQTFTDMIVGGEASRMQHVGNYYNFLTPELFRATYSPYIYGIKMVFLDENIRHLRFEKIPFDLDTPNEIRRSVLHTYGYALTHDVDMHRGMPEVDERVWAAQDAIGWDTGVRFFPYWEQDAVQLVSPASDRLLASAYSNQGKLLLAVLNDTDETQKLELKLDLEQMGVAAGLPGQAVFATDQRYQLGTTWQDELSPRGIRLIVFRQALP